MSKIPNDDSELQFVLLRHDMESSTSGRSSHWDLMMQFGKQLETWALDHDPHEISTIKALRLDDHRIDYLNYEGPVSNNRGTVTRLDRGRMNWISRDVDLRIAELAGERVSGQIRLEQLPKPEASPTLTRDSVATYTTLGRGEESLESAANDFWQFTFLNRS